MKLFVTGAAGFIGSNYVRWVLANSDHEVTILDALTYAGNLASLAGLDASPRFTFVRADICDGSAVRAILASSRPVGILHLAAESHVDRSIDAPEQFGRYLAGGK